MTQLEQLEEARDAVTRTIHLNRGQMLLAVENTMRVIAMNNKNRDSLRFSEVDEERQRQAFNDQEVHLLVDRVLRAARTTVALDEAQR